MSGSQNTRPTHIQWADNLPRPSREDEVRRCPRRPRRRPRQVVDLDLQVERRRYMASTTGEGKQDIDDDDDDDDDANMHPGCFLLIIVFLEPESELNQPTSAQTRQSSQHQPVQCLTLLCDMRPTHTPTILERELADSAVPNADQYSASVYSRASNDELVSASTSTSTSDSDDETDVAAMLPGNDTTDLGTARGHLIESILRTLALFSSLLTAISPPCPFLATSIYLPTQLQGGLQCNATQCEAFIATISQCKLPAST
ncbi:hypothetical protein IWX49DRAFT_555385 [Phyllosticta citricarpa]